jgi:hypothetical protein
LPNLNPKNFKRYSRKQSKIAATKTREADNLKVSFIILMENEFEEQFGDLGDETRRACNGKFKGDEGEALLLCFYSR